MEGRVEACFVLLRPVHMIIPEDFAADFHSPFIHVTNRLLRPKKAIDLVCHPLGLFNWWCMPGSRQESKAGIRKGRGKLLHDLGWGGGILCAA